MAVRRPLEFARPENRLLLHRPRHRNPGSCRPQRLQGPRHRSARTDLRRDRRTRGRSRRAAGCVLNANWLRPGVPGAGQQAFGDGLSSAYPFVLIPSAVSTHSWNLLFDIDVGPHPVRDAGAGRFRAGHAAASTAGLNCQGHSGGRRQVRVGNAICPVRVTRAVLPLTPSNAPPNPTLEQAGFACVRQYDAVLKCLTS